MKNLIEEATKRLQQLEQAGITVPASAPAPAPRARTRAAAEQERREPYLPEERAAERVDRPRAANVRVIDLARLQVNGFITPMVTDSRLLRELRVVKRPLIQNALGRSAAPIANGNLIMMTSSVPGEGKSFLSLNLAMSMAMEVDCRVLLVDADVVRPTLPRLLDLPPAKGLMDILASGAGVGDVLLKTNVPRLDLLLAGTQHPGAEEFLASQNMARLLAELSSRYADRIILFDSPPLLATTESRVLARHMGQVVVVVEAERTTHGLLESALATIETCPVVMTMLNKTSASETGSYHGYGYGYGYGESR